MIKMAIYLKSSTFDHSGFDCYFLFNCVFLSESHIKLFKRIRNEVNRVTKLELRDCVDKFKNTEE